MAGLLFPKKGAITINGFRPSERQPAFLADVFLVPEEFYLPDVRIADFVQTNAPFYPRFNREQFDQYISVFEVPQDATLLNMSYGQKKKVLISFALAAHTRLLLMDEPTNGLDIMSKSQFRKVLAEAVDEERCIIISTHQVKDLEHLIDRVTVLEDGTVLFDATIETIARKLSFRLTYDRSEADSAFYSERVLAGNVIVAPNTTGEESQIDLELLYKAIITNRGPITQLF
jgi:ABC-2 type transport system ATP-binding protein